LFQHFLCGKKSDQPLKPLERKVPEAMGKNSSNIFSKSPKSYQIFFPKAFYVMITILYIKSEVLFEIPLAHI